MKHVFVLIALLVSLTATAQPNLEKKAQKFTDEMTKVLSLNKEESKAIYEIQLNRFKENQSVLKEFDDNPEMKKEKLNELGNKVYNQIKNVIGVARQKQWKTYKNK